MPAMGARISLSGRAAFGLAGLVALVVLARTATAAPKKKYHFQLVEVSAAATIPDAARTDVTQVVKSQVEKALAGHTQIATTLEGAPDPKVDPKTYKTYLTRKKIAGAYRVNVEVTEVSEATEDVDDKPGELRLVVRVGLRMFGETIPDRVMAFSGDGSAAVKTEVGKKVRPRDRQFALESAAEMAVAEALEMSLTKLAQPPKKPSKK